MLKRRLFITLIALSVTLALSACASETEAKKSINQPDLSNPERLNISAPTFSSTGIRFELNDTRPNTSVSITIDVGYESADKRFMMWVFASRIKPGVFSVPFREFRYFDDGLYRIKDAEKCRVTVEAQLKNGNKTVSTAYDAPVSDLRAALAGSLDLR